MEDNQIIELYWNRSENAISETDKKYGEYCSYIANNILQNKEDSIECLNDVYLNTWNTIPPKRPNVLKLFLAKITRNVAINKYKNLRAKKRNSNMELVLEELEDCISNNESVENIIEYNELVTFLNEFIEKLPINKKKIFLDRYWYLNSIKDISLKNKISENNVKVILYRLRNELKDFLIERGIIHE